MHHAILYNQILFRAPTSQAGLQNILDFPSVLLYYLDLLTQKARNCFFIQIVQIQKAYPLGVSIQIGFKPYIHTLFNRRASFISILAGLQAPINPLQALIIVFHYYRSSLAHLPSPFFSSLQYIAFLVDQILGLNSPISINIEDFRCNSQQLIGLQFNLLGEKGSLFLCCIYNSNLVKIFRANNLINLSIS